MAAIFNAYLVCSLMMSLTAAVFLLFSVLFSKRYKAKIQYYAWLVIIIGFIIPLRPKFIALNSSAIEIKQMSETPITTEYAHATVSEPLWETEIPAGKSSAAMTGPEILALIWLPGVIWTIVMQAFKYYRFMKTVRRWNEEPVNSQLIHILRGTMDDMGIRANVKMIKNPFIRSPILIGLIHSAILLPDCNYSEDELSFIIKHELVHLKRNDLLWKCAILVAKALHWFNPVVYLASRAAIAQCELSCDEGVICSKDSDERARYGKAIYDSVAFQAGIKTDFVTNFNGGKKLMKKRLLSVMNMKNRKKGFTALALAFIMTLSSGAVLASYKTEAQYLKELGIVYEEEKGGYCYDGRLVGLFIDRCRNGEGIVYYNNEHEVNLKVLRDERGEYLDMIELGGDVAYEINLYEQELREHWNSSNSFDEWGLPPGNISKKYPGVPLVIPSSKEETDYLAHLGISYDQDKNGYCYNGQLVGLFLDRCRNGQGIIFLNRNGEVNIKINRGILGFITKVEVLSDNVDYEIEAYRKELKDIQQHG